MSVAVVQLYSNHSSGSGFEPRNTEQKESHGIETIKAAEGGWSMAHTSSRTS